MDEFIVDNLIAEAIADLADDNANRGAETLQELAQLFAMAGIPQESFQNIRKHIIDSAIELTDPFFIQLKLEKYERKLQEKRTGNVRRIITH